jgi:hypothetical protein
MSWIRILTLHNNQHINWVLDDRKQIPWKQIQSFLCTHWMHFFFENMPGVSLRGKKSSQHYTGRNLDPTHRRVANKLEKLMQKTKASSNPQATLSL